MACADRQAIYLQHRVPSCGDGIGELPEECDDGAANSDTAVGACRTDCRLPRCNDGILDPGEACDDGNLTENDGCDTNCTVSGCGNGAVGGTEECDDGVFNSDTQFASLMVKMNLTQLLEES